MNVFLMVLSFSSFATKLQRAWYSGVRSVFPCLASVGWCLLGEIVHG